MRRTLTVAAAAMIALSGIAGTAAAEPYGHARGHDEGRGNDRYEHSDRGNHWRRGQRISRDEWGRYQRVDWRRHHLRRPPRGYEWREVNGQYVLAAAATGLIAAIIASSR